MEISITYCAVWNYLPRATSLAAAIERETGSDPELIPGSNGIFDVVADGRLVFSKHDSGRFPDDDEVCTALRSGW